MNSLPKCLKWSKTATIVSLSLGFHNVVFAQEAANNEQESELYENIVITASKRATGLQETPIAVTVTSAEAIEQTQVLDIQDMQALVPTLRVTPLQQSNNTNFSIRGFGNGTNNTGIEPSVGVFIDGVYRSRAAAQIGDLPRLDQVEVLSGPQSTLFGKNASAGVISVRTAAPSFAQAAKIQAGIGNYNQRLLRGYYTNGINDDLAVSFSGGFNKRDGFTDSIVGLDDLNNRDRWNIRGQALYEPTDEVTFRFIADYSEIDERCCTVANVIDGPTGAAVRALGGAIPDSADPFGYNSALNQEQRNEIEDGGVSLQIDVDYEAFTLTSITSYRNNTAAHSIDNDFTSLDIIREDGEIDIDTFTQEVRLASTDEGDFGWMVGAFYFSEEVDTNHILSFNGGIRPYFDALGLAPLIATAEDLYGQARGTFFADGTFQDTSFNQDNDALSIFVNFDYKITDRLTATFGANYTEDEKEVTLSELNTTTIAAIDFTTDPTVLGVPLASIPDFAPFIPTLQGVQFLPQKILFPNAVEDGKTKDDKVTWSLRLAYEINDNFNVFATAATGFKASSWNLSRDTRPFPEDQAALAAAGLTQPNQNFGTRFAGPEDSKVYELGVKARFKNGAFNVTLFDQTIEGFQSSIFRGTGFVLANAGEQSTKGIEFDSKYNLTDNLVVSLAGTFLDPTYDSFVGGNGLNGPTDLSGTQPAGIHDRSIVAGITYNHDFDNGMTGYVRSDYLYENEVALVENVPPELTRQVGTLNASAGLNFENGFAVQIWARNLNNDEYFLSAFPAPIQSGSFNAYPNPPRTFGINVSYLFE